jgi:serine/threonine protein phosphatase PrpC
MALDPQRRRLTVAKCDPVKGGSVSEASSSVTPETLPKKLLDAGLFEAFSKDTLFDHKAIAVHSTTDKVKKTAYSNKDFGVLTPLERASEADELLKWVHEKGVAFCCKKGMKPESPNQDSFSLVVIEGEYAVYGVFDGHGPCGHDVSELVRQELMKKFIQDPLRLEDPEKALKSAFLETQKVIASQSGMDASMSGSTCSVAYHDFKSDVLFIAHAGDSRGVLQKFKPSGGGTEVEELTVDHKPNLTEENRRIESANPPGRVVFDGYYNYRVFAMDGMYPGLNMSRALGDLVAHTSAGLTALPDVKRIDLKAAREQYDKMLLYICTDGVWEFIESSELEAIVPDQAVEKLAKESYDRWMKDSEGEVSDDITAILVKL